MSQLSNLTDAGRSDVIPGYVLSAPRLRHWGQAEDAFARWHVARVGRSVAKLPLAMQERVVNAAVAEVKAGEFTIGMPGFDAFARSARGTLYMFRHCLRVKHPQVTNAEADRLFGEHETAAAAATLALLGYEVPGAGDPAKKARGRTARPAHSTGSRSTKPSAPVAA